MNLLHLLWIIPLCVYIGSIVEKTFGKSSERELVRICKQCWHKWEMGIQQSEPGLRREFDIDISENED